MCVHELISRVDMHFSYPSSRKDMCSHDANDAVVEAVEYSLMLRACSIEFYDGVSDRGFLERCRVSPSARWRFGWKTGGMDGDFQPDLGLLSIVFDIAIPKSTSSPQLKCIYIAIRRIL